MTNGVYQDAFNLFSDSLSGIETFYATIKIKAFQGNCLALMAGQYKSSVQAILDANTLPQQTVLASDQTIIVPYMQ